MNQQRSKVAALLLNIIPGLGHLYWGNKGRIFIYFLLIGTGMLGSIALSVLSGDNEWILVGLAGVFIVWCISMLDIVIVLLNSPPASNVPPEDYGLGRDYRSYPDRERGNEAGDEDRDAHMEFAAEESDRPPYPPIGEGRMLSGAESFSDSERFYTVILSFVPGLGHLYMGLLQRGVSFLVAFFGLATALVFLTGITHNHAFLLFMGVLPIVWIYGMFDAVQLAERKSRGEKVRDFSLVEQWDMDREGGHKSRTLALVLSVVPGAGQMYMGLMQRGAQFMLLFFGSIYVLDVLGFSLFLFLVPLIWFYSFFDALQQIGRYGREPLFDKPLIQSLLLNRRWIGIALVLLGVYYIFDRVVLVLMEAFMHWKLAQLRVIYDYAEPAIVPVLLMIGGIVLIRSRKNA
ncbi:hypothetical protein QWJ34_07780 [Saccharibacillus sp. CPCC 101409]|uniref:hypothetical protein n=1 Tax=Saccharibacillus sp. CPCC 101409 TaxID=3058041 RepID=UPI0026712DA9|nr:hypothetical protein [Saccharibacillus sp. CPCC 101409]MDO3409660.1 hypothetical protein [Saccharibacillus sp. CPCC 101409]